MKNTIITVFIALAVGLACSDKESAGQQSKAPKSASENAKNMAQLISIVEIPTDSFQRAIKFYESVLNLKIQVIDMQGTQMGLFPAEQGSVSVALVNGSEYKPADYGTLAYLNGGKDLQTVLSRVVANGGKVVVPKTEIDPENGFFATFMDSEGNKVGLHSNM